MSAPKTLGRYGLLAKLESTYGTEAVPSNTTDGLLVVERPDVGVRYADEGERAGGGQGPAGGLQAVAKSGRHGELELVHEAAGAGVAYAASVLPSPHLLLRACGFDAAVTTTASAERVVYTPTDAPAAVTLHAFARGQLAKLTGALGQLSIGGDHGTIPRWVASIMGIMPALPADAAVPAITYAGAQAQVPAKAQAMAVTIGDFAPLRVKSFQLSQERGLAARALDNTTGTHGGFVPAADIAYTLELVVEAAPLTAGAPFHAAATLNPYQLAELATALPIAFTVGAAQYKRWKLAAPAAQLAADPDQDENNAAQWALSFRLKPSALGLNDAVSFTFD